MGARLDLTLPLLAVLEWALNLSFAVKQSVTSPKAEFDRMVSAFRHWAAEYTHAGMSGEWECAFEEWPEMWAVLDEFLISVDPEEWDDEIIASLLYVIARDNEREILKQTLETKPIHLLALARAGIHSKERDARWQLADALGRSGLDAEVVTPLLERFINDEDEYVSRRALLALGGRLAPEAEALALRAWATGHEYQRMAALDVLSSLASPLLSSHLEAAEQDGRQYLVSFARKISSDRQ